MIESNIIKPFVLGRQEFSLLKYLYHKNVYNLQLLLTSVERILLCFAPADSLLAILLLHLDSLYYRIRMIKLSVLHYGIKYVHTLIISKVKQNDTIPILFIFGPFIN